MIQSRINPFKHEYFLGYISQVLPQFVKIHFPSSVLLNGFTHFGQEFNGGLVGNFVVIEGEKFGFLGRITELSLPESERLSLNERAFQTSDFHPTGKIEILLSFDLYEPLKAKKGLSVYPTIGAKVFVSSGELVQEYMSRFGDKGDDNFDPTILGTLVSSGSTTVKANLQAIFGRHCAVVGTTGGGKSYTVSKLIESVLELNNKAILFDATGEYSCFDFLPSSEVNKLGTDCFFNYSDLSISDLFVIFRPGGQLQQPLLLEAINSLKLVTILERDHGNFSVTNNGNIKSFGFKNKNNEQISVEVENGCIIKGGKKTQPFNRLCAIYAEELNDFTNTNFKIKNLTRQINNECHPVFGDQWGANIDTRNQGNASSLILRIHQVLSDPEFRKIFGFDFHDKKDIISEINNFISSSNKSHLLRIAFDNVPFTYQIREIVSNAIGSYLLKSARIGKFDYKKDKNHQPVILFIDEAHQFINKSVKDEYFQNTSLDAFDLIAKECRKHGLFLCIATQMPRDIPHGTLSQMGTFIVHRLINQNDKDAIINACSSANKNTLDFLPILGEGEAVLTGVDFPMPIIIKFNKPKFEPNSQTPKLGNKKN
jgi:hypothetical protein